MGDVKTGKVCLNEETLAPCRMPPNKSPRPVIKTLETKMYFRRIKTAAKGKKTATIDVNESADRRNDSAGTRRGSLVGKCSDFSTGAKTLLIGSQTVHFSLPFFSKVNTYCS